MTTDIKPAIPIRTITKETPYSICFVCLGNICRSPTAEGVMQHLVTKAGLQSYFYIDSAGTASYHIGELPDSKSREVAAQHNVVLRSRARQFRAEDLGEFDLILAMDHENYSDILALDRKNAFSGKVALLRSFDPYPSHMAVPDPYYGGLEGFEKVYDIIRRSCNELLEVLETHINFDS